MDQEKDKIPSPFQAPEGYFDAFEARLEARLSPSKGQPVMKVHRNLPQEKPFVPAQAKESRPMIEWIAVAATIAVLAVSGVMFYMKLNTREEVQPVAKLEKPAPKRVEVPKEVVLSPEIIEDQVMAVILEDAEQSTVSATPEKALTRREAATAAELEDAGLIVLEANDGLFDQFEL